MAVGNDSMPGKEGESEIVQGDLGRHIAKALRGLRFGSIEIVVHDGRVVQIERKEKLRLEKDRQGKDARE